MKNITFLLFFGLFITAAGCTEEEIGPSNTCTYTPPTYNHPRAAAYQAVVNKYTAAGLPGIAILIRDEEGEWVSSAGFADIAKGVPMQPCAVSKAASITKTFIGTLTLMLVEDGVLSLDDPLDKWLPSEVIRKVRNAGESNIRMLLNHTTGIADVISDSRFYLAVLNNPPHRWTPEELIAFVYGDDPYFEPGASVEYSNTNFLLLAMILNKALDEDHSTALRNRILEPLHLNNTYYYWHDDLPEGIVQGYFDLYNNGAILNLTNYNTGSGNGYGGIYTSVFDLQTFIEALVREKSLLQPATLDEMLTFTQPEGVANRANGLGIFKDFLERAPNEYAYGHRGRDLGYTADAFWFPNQDATLVYLINYGTDAKSELRDVFFNFRREIVDVLMAN